MTHDERSEVTETPNVSQAFTWLRDWKTLKPFTAEEVRTVQKRIQRRIEADIINTFLNGRHIPKQPEPGTITLATDTRRPTPRNRKERRAAKHRRQP